MSKQKRGPGRPPKEPSDLITIDQAVEVIKEHLLSKYGNPEVAKQCSYSKGTLYNKSCSGEINTWRRGKYALVSRSEVLKLVS